MSKMSECIAFITEHYLQYNTIRYDAISNKLQIQVVPTSPSTGEAGVTLWREMNSIDINNIVCQCAQECQANITSSDAMTVLKSDLVPKVHPLRDYVESLKPYTPDQPDWIDMVARQVHVKGNDKTECGINKDNLNNHSYLAQWARTIITASPTLLSGSEYIYQQYQQLEINNNNNSLASANVGRAQKLFKLSLE